MPYPLPVHMYMCMYVWFKKPAAKAAKKPAAKKPAAKRPAAKKPAVKKLLIKLQKFTTEFLDSFSNFLYVCEPQKKGSKSAFLSQSQHSINNAK